MAHTMLPMQPQFLRRLKMKYTRPEYKNERATVEDVITNSYYIAEEKNEQGEVTKVTINGYLSHLLGKQ